MKNFKRLNKLITSILLIAVVATVFPIIGYANTWDKTSCGVPEMSVVIEHLADGSGPDAQFNLDGTEKYSGNYSAKMVYGDAPAEGMQFRITKNAPATVGKRYRCGFMAKAKNASDIKFCINSVGNWMNLTKSYGTTFDWKLIEFEFVFTREQFTTMEFIVASWGRCNGFWVDDVYVYEVDDSGNRIGDNLFKNPGFEDAGTEVPLGTEVKEDNVLENNDAVTTLDSSEIIMLDEAKNISIDGNISDWKDYNTYSVGQLRVLSGFEDATVIPSADIKYAYDDKYFYFALKTEDEKHVLDENGKYWNGDSPQFAIDNNNANGYGQPFAMTFDETTGAVTVYDGTSLAPLDISKIDGIEAAASRNGTTDVYEFKVSWDYLGISKPDKFKFNLMINDNDGNGRKGWREIAPNISENRTKEPYPWLYINRTDIVYSITNCSDKKADINGGDVTDVNINESNYYKLVVQNITDKDVLLSISGDATKIVEIPSEYQYTYYIEKTFGEYGDNSVKVALKDELTGKTYDCTYDVTVIPTEDTYKGLIDEAKAWTATLKELVDKCENNRIDIPYENARYKIVDMFTGYMQDEYDNYKAFYRIGHYYLTLKDIYTELEPRLQGILKGEIKPLETTETVSDVYYDYNAKKFYGTVLKDGKLEKQPVLLTGYQNFLVDEHYDEQAMTLGQNSVSLGNMYVDFVKPLNGKYVLRDENEVVPWLTKPALKELDELLDKYDKMGVSVYYGFSQTFDTSLEADMKESGKDYYMFMTFNPTHPRINEQIELIMSAVMPIVNKHKCVTSLMMQNEPSFYSYDKAYYQRQWENFLSERYNGDIAQLNKAYGSEYKDFTEVPRSSTATNDVKFNDYRNFNDSILKGFYDKIRTEIRKYNKDIPIWTKEMMPTRSYGGAKTAGVNAEVLAECFDLNGNDAFGMIDQAGLPFAGKMEWYDIQTSIIDAPVMNGENHIIADDGMKILNYNPQYDFHYAADVWEGMIHGAGLQEYWLFSRTDRALKSYGQTSLLFRPATLDKAAKATLDIHRLTPQIVALQDKKRETAILYSDTSWSFSGQFMNAMYQTYTNLLYLGQRPKFVLESQTDKINIDNYKMIVVPACTNVTADVITKLDEFVKNGGKLVIVGEGSLYYNPKGEKHDETVVKRLYDNATVVDAKIDTSSALINIDENYKDILDKNLTDLSLMDIELIDADTGKKCNEVAYLGTQYEGKTIINLCNYSWDGTKNVDIYINGKKVESARELRNDEPVNGTISLDSFVPVLVEVS